MAKASLSSSTIERLQRFNAEVFRTDMDGSVIFTTNGDGVLVTTERGDVL